MLNPKWHGLPILGFGIVVISDAGDLVAWGRGVQPEWCDSASAAEAWALAQAVRSAAPNVPRVLTDCLRLLHAVEKGEAAASAANMKLARTWRHVASTLDGNLLALKRSGSLTLPAGSASLASPTAAR